MSKISYHLSHINLWMYFIEQQFCGRIFLAGIWLGGKMAGGILHCRNFPGGKLKWREYAWRNKELAGIFLAGFFWRESEVAVIWIGGKIETHQIYPPRLDRVNIHNYLCIHMTILLFTNVFYHTVYIQN